MKKLVFILILAGMVSLFSGCSNIGSSSAYRIEMMGSNEAISSMFDVDYYDAYVDCGIEPDEIIEFDFNGTHYWGKYSRDSYYFPYKNELFVYWFTDTADFSSKERLGWIEWNPVSEDIVQYSFLGIIDKEKTNCLPEDELQQIADSYAAQYIDINEFECTRAKRKAEDAFSDYFFDYRRSITGINLSERIFIVLSCEGEVVSLKKTTIPEWEEAINNRGAVYYSEVGEKLTSNTVLEEIQKVFDKEEITYWEIEGNAMFLLDEKNAALSYVINYQITIGKTSYNETARIIVSEK